jgi:hypothetical protein
MGVDANGEIIQHFFNLPGKSNILLAGSPDIQAIADALAQKCQDFINAPA